MSTNLVVPQQVKSQLLAAFVAWKKAGADEITGPVVGTTYYAYLSASRTYWALATFATTRSATFQTGVTFQDGGSEGLFSRQAGQPWQVHPVEGGPWPCPGDLDPELGKLWNKPLDPNCSVIYGSASAGAGAPTATASPSSSHS